MKFQLRKQLIHEATDPVKQSIMDADNEDVSDLEDAYYGVADNMPLLKKRALAVLGKDSVEYKNIEKLATMFDRLTLGKYL